MLATASDTTRMASDEVSESGLSEEEGAGWRWRVEVEGVGDRDSGDLQDV